MDQTRLYNSDTVFQDFWKKVRKKTNVCEANIVSVGKNQVRAYNFYLNWKKKKYDSEDPMLASEKDQNKRKSEIQGVNTCAEVVKRNKIQ